MTRAEHLEWAKRRAREYHERGDMMGAVVSLASDITKHRETDGSYLIGEIGVGMQAALRGDMAAVKRWIEGFR